MSDLREAATRYRNSDYEDNVGGSFHRQEDAETLADAYLAEHPADSDETITEEWLREMGWVAIGNTWYPPESSLPKGRYTMPLVLWCRVDGTIRLGGGNEWESRYDATRGQLRLLLRALNIGKETT